MNRSDAPGEMTSLPAADADLMMMMMTIMMRCVSANPHEQWTVAFPAASAHLLQTPVYHAARFVLML